MLVSIVLVITTLSAINPSLGRPDLHHYPKEKSFKKNSFVEDDNENTSDYWNQLAKDAIQKRLATKIIEGVANNVIIFLGDGMSVPTLAATRSYMGGVNQELSFDKFPHTAISKTYCVDFQVPDSACTATAYLGGVKGNIATIGLNGNVPYSDCAGMMNTTNHVDSIANWAQAAAKSTGFVTNCKVTDASPAGVYGHTSNREWQADTDIIASGEDPDVCLDLATQLVNGVTGRNLNVVMGGGRKPLLPMDVIDEEGAPGSRTDGVNLIDKWQQDKVAENKSATYVWNRQQLLELSGDVDYVLGLFESEDFKYNLERDEVLDPTLTEMMEAAIRILSKNPNGYFLFVEGGMIDSAHHETYARKAFDETVEFSKAIERALDLTSEDDTLIVVTADHAHTMSFGGYIPRGTDVLGLAGIAADDLPFTSINYAGSKGYSLDGSQRHDLTQDDFGDLNYTYPAAYPLNSETHGGDDVIVFAKGPWAHLFTGVMEQNVIPHIMGYASCMGPDSTACDVQN